MMGDDDRAVSIAISHTLTLAITAILITTLLVAAGDFLQTQQQQAAREQFESIGADVSALVDHADSLTTTGESVGATLDANYPAFVTGEPYRVRLITDGPGRSTTGTVYLNSSVLPQPVGVPVQSETPLEQSTFRSSSDQQGVTVCPTASGHYITLEGCS
jgi:type II secretory pathway pseudopilin PulG